MKGLIALLLVICLLFVGCGGTSPSIPQDAINQIYTLSQDEIINQYIEIRTVEERADYCYVSMNIKYVPEIITNLEDAYIQAQVYTDAIAKDTVRILSEYNINQDVSVWAQLPLGNGKVALLGNTWYDAETQSFEFKRYKP